MSTIQYIPIGFLYPHPDNPRKSVGDITELADSIRANGVMQNLTVIDGHWMTEQERQDVEKIMKTCETENDRRWFRSLLECGHYDTGYTVLIGHRRLEAAKLAGLEELPCIVAPYMSREKQIAIMLVENMQRVDLTVYEQAQAFQLMLDMGEDVETIAERSGFSKTTVKRRLKMAELDQEKLRQVSARQIRLEDFDRLAQIEDMKRRNEVLDAIGTHNFAGALSAALTEQTYNHNLPLLKQAALEAGLKELPEGERYSGKWTKIAGLRVYEWNPSKGLKVPKNATCFCVTLWREAEFFKRSPQSKKQQSAEQIAGMKLQQELTAGLCEATRQAYKLRLAFVGGLRVTRTNYLLYLRGAVLGACYSAAQHCGVRNSVSNVFGIQQRIEQYEKQNAAIRRAGDECADEDIPKGIYAIFGDCADNGYYNRGYSNVLPTHMGNPALDALYRWLGLLGYEMSDEERALQDGTHRLFRKEAEEK